MKNEAQIRILLLQQYLCTLTDEEHAASVSDILQFWESHGIQAGRKSVYGNIQILIDQGVDVVCVKSTQNRYFVGSRLFELPELKLLVDAVESSHFITRKKSASLIRKLASLTSQEQARQLNRPVYMEGTAKQDNEAIYYAVDTIHTAIQEKRRIAFQYIEYTAEKEKVLKHDGYRYEFSPYALIWSRDYYYAVGWSEKHGKLAQFRVDRMTAVKLLVQEAIPAQDFDPAAYVHQVFGMFGADIQEDNTAVREQHHAQCCRPLRRGGADGDRGRGALPGHRGCRTQPALFRLGLYFWWENPYHGTGGDCGENERDGNVATMISLHPNLQLNGDKSIEPLIERRSLSHAIPSQYPNIDGFFLSRGTSRFL